MTENIVGQEENAFSPFPTMFSKAFFFRVIKISDCVVKSQLNLAERFPSYLQMSQIPPDLLLCQTTKFQTGPNLTLYLICQF